MLILKVIEMLDTNAFLVHPIEFTATLNFIMYFRTEHALFRGRFLHASIAKMSSASVFCNKILENFLLQTLVLE